MAPSQSAQRIALHEQERLGHVRPAGWVQPTPAKRYDLVVVGAGAVGLAVAVEAAAEGAKVALVERQQLGGIRLNSVGVPLQALLAAAQAAVSLRQTAAQGLEAGPLKVDYESVVERLKRLRARIAHVDGAPRLGGLGIDVYFGDGVFTGPSTLKAGDVALSFKRACVATGARPTTPAVPGLADSGYLTVETIWDVTALPKKLVVLGGGSLGCGFAQAFARLGSQVFLIEAADRVLPREDPAASAVVRETLENEGVRVFTGAKVDRVVRVGPQVGVSFSGPLGSPATGDHLLVVTGRAPNVDGLGLEAAGVAFDRHGVGVDDRLRTSNRRIYAVGGCVPGARVGPPPLAFARLVVENALFFGRKRVSRLAVPTVTHTDPEVAQVGLTAEGAKAAGLGVESFEVSFGEDDRAVLDGATRGFVKLHVQAGTDELLGATVVGTDAGGLVAQAALALSNGLGAGALAASVVPDPSRSQALVRAAGLAVTRARTPFARRLRFFLLGLLR